MLTQFHVKDFIKVLSTWYARGFWLSLGIHPCESFPTFPSYNLDLPAWTWNWNFEPNLFGGKMRSAVNEAFARYFRSIREGKQVSPRKTGLIRKILIFIHTWAAGIDAAWSVRRKSVLANPEGRRVDGSDRTPFSIRQWRRVLLPGRGDFLNPSYMRIRREDKRRKNV